MISQELRDKINNHEITTRRELYRHLGGRSRALTAWLDKEGLLLSRRNYWTKRTIQEYLRKKHDEIGRIPRAVDVDTTVVKVAQKKFRSWNNALFETFGGVNQHRYSDLSNDDLLKIIRDFVVKYQRLPSRELFNGNEYPDWETYSKRFGGAKWSEILDLADLAGLTYFGQHGYGRIYKHKGITYLSHGEFLIGRYLTEKCIDFEKEVPYGNAKYIFDFYVPSLDLYIEYYGIGEAWYKEKTEDKRRYYAGRYVLEIFKHDNTIKKLDFEVQRLQSSLTAQ